MSAIKLIDEFRAFMDFADENGLYVRERALWIALFYIAGDKAEYNTQTGEYNWTEDFFSVSMSKLSSHTGLDKRGIDEARNKLKQRGLIDFQPGDRRKATPKYKLNYLTAGFGYKNVPNQLPNSTPIAPQRLPNSTPIAPQRLPNSTPSNNDYDIDIDIDLDIFQRKYNINNNYRDSARARMATAQRLVEIISAAKPRLILDGTNMLDRIEKALLQKLTPYTVYQLAGNTDDWRQLMYWVEEPPAWALAMAERERWTRYEQR